jgi:hypothetical protein
LNDLSTLEVDAPIRTDKESRLQLSGKSPGSAAATLNIELIHPFKIEGRF